MYIVLEYLLLENFIINLLILYLTKILTNKDSKNKRIIIGAIISSLYSLCFFYPILIPFTKAPAKFIFSLIIIKISFKYYNLKSFFRQLMSFYIISFIFAGATLGVFFTSFNNSNFWTKTVNLFSSFPAKYLFIGILLSVLIVKAVFQYYNLKIIRANYIAQVQILYKEKSITINALLDTGNSLVQPFSKNKVLVVEYEKLKNILPSEILDLYVASEKGDYTKCEEILTKLQDEIKLIMIPFKSVGKNGIIYGFKPEGIIITYMNEITARQDILIGIYTDILSSEAEYSGLLHYGLINGGVENANT